MRHPAHAMNTEVFLTGPAEDGTYTLEIDGLGGKAQAKLTEAQVRTLQFTMSNVVCTGKLVATKRARRSA